MMTHRELNTDVGTGTRGITSGTGANRPALGQSPALGKERGIAMGATQRHSAAESVRGGHR